MKKPTPTAAVLWGILFVNGPMAIVIVAGGFEGFRISRGSELPLVILGLSVGGILGSLLAWLWWSFAVPQWRDWVQDHGLMPAEVQRLAVRTGLLWPEGSAFQRTEFRRRDGRRGW